jgi:hypothetical protein
MITNDTSPDVRTATPAPPTTNISNPLSKAGGPTGRLRLGEVRTQLATADAALDGWYARQVHAGYPYVTDGHQAIRLIDAAIRGLYRVRDALISEIRADQDERAARVDRILDEFNARVADVLASELDGGAAV